MNGVLITFEGGEAGGKSTQIRLLAEALRGAGLDVVTTREPGGSPGAEDIRTLVKLAAHDFDAVTAQLLFMAARRDHLSKAVLPALARGAVVLVDRYVHSTLAYQGGDDPEAWAGILADHERFCHGLLPDLAILLDVDFDTACRRLHGRGIEPNDAFESRPRAFHERSRRAFLAMADAGIGNLVVIDGSGGVDDTAERVGAMVRTHLGINAISTAHDVKIAAGC